MVVIYCLKRKYFCRLLVPSFTDLLKSVSECCECCVLVEEGKVVIESVISNTWFSAMYTEVRMGWNLMIICIGVSEKVKHFFFYKHQCAY